MFSRLAFYYAFILVLLSSGFAQRGYESGYYVDKYDSVHSGLIKYVPPTKLDIGLNVDLDEFNNFYFKKKSQSDELWIRPDMVKLIVVSNDSFEVIPVGISTKNFILSVIKKDVFLDFAKILERGKIDLLKHTYRSKSVRHGFPISSVEILSDYYLKKDIQLIRIEKGAEQYPTQLNSAEIQNLIGDDQILLRSFDAGNYHKTDTRRLIEDYNARARGDVQSTKLVLIRASKREINESITLGIGKEMISMPQNHMDTISITNVYDFEVCPKDEDCQNLTGTLGKFVFMEVSKKEENTTRLSLMNEDEIKFYTTRIAYLMEKAAKKKRK